MKKINLKRIINLPGISVAILYPLCSNNAIADSNHNNASGNQTVVVSDVDINNDYYSFYTDGSIDMTVDNTTVDKGSSVYDPFIVNSDSSTVDFNANNLTTIGGSVDLTGSGDITAAVSDSHLGSADYNGADSLWLNSWNGNASATVDTSVLTGRLDIDAVGDVSAKITHAEVDQGVTVMGSGADSSAYVAIEDSNVTAENSDNSYSAAVHAEGGSGGATVKIDDSTIGLAPDSALAVSQDVEVFTENAGQASVIVNNSSVEDGVDSYSAGGNAQIEVNNSQIGTEDTAGDVNYMLLAQSARGAVGQGTASLSVNNSQVEGDITAQSQGDGDARILLTNGSTVNGSVRLVGSDMELDIDGATLNGNIEASSYTESDIGAEGTNMTLNLSDTTYRGNIDSNDDEINEALTVNINDGAIIGGESIDSAMQITGYDTVNFNVNYLDPSLINSGTESYFYLDDGEQVNVNSSLANGTLSPIRSGSYIMNNVVYQATDVSDQTTTADEGTTWGVSFYTNDPTPPDEGDVAADIQAAQAGLMASDDMIHRIADGITHQLDSAKTDQNSHLWMQGIYASGDRTAGATDYSNNISGMQIGGDVSRPVGNDSVVGVGLALGYLNNDLDLNNHLDGHNNIDGTYYSIYANWKQLLSDNKTWGWFADTVFTYGDMSYSSDGRDGDISAGGDYDGRSWLVQGRAGAQINATRQLWLRPYLTLGYDNIHTDGFNDGYSDVSNGKQDGGFSGVGIQAGTNYQLRNVDLKPYVELAYLDQFGTDTNFHTDDYDFSGQNLNGGNAGVGVEAKFAGNWSADTRVNTEFGHDVDNEVNAYINVKYQF